MGCRVLKRTFEHAMFDALVAEARKRGIGSLVGYYARTERNGMVEGHYEALGFERSLGEAGGAVVWRLELSCAQRALRNTHIQTGGSQNGIDHREAAAALS